MVKTPDRPALRLGYGLLFFISLFWVLPRIETRLASAYGRPNLANNSNPTKPIIFRCRARFVPYLLATTNSYPISFGSVVSAILPTILPPIAICAIFTVILKALLLSTHTRHAAFTASALPCLPPVSYTHLTLPTNREV